MIRSNMVWYCTRKCGKTNRISLSLSLSLSLTNVIFSPFVFLILFSITFFVPPEVFYLYFSLSSSVQTASLSLSLSLSLIMLLRHPLSTFHQYAIKCHVSSFISFTINKHQDIIDITVFKLDWVRISFFMLLVYQTMLNL